MPSRWWARAESLALDILEDLRFWAVGWTDWNLVLDTHGGPNHLRNLCDANIIADPTRRTGKGTIVLQVHALLGALARGAYACRARAAHRAREAHRARACGRVGAGEDGALECCAVPWGGGASDLP